MRTCKAPQKIEKRQQKKPHHTHQPIQQTRAKPQATRHCNTFTVILLIDSTSLKRKETEIVVGAEIASLSTATRVRTY
jgi:hypothetical protein